MGHQNRRIVRKREKQTISWKEKPRIRRNRNNSSGYKSLRHGIQHFFIMHQIDQKAATMMLKRKLSIMQSPTVKIGN